MSRKFWFCAVAFVWFQVLFVLGILTSVEVWASLTLSTIITYVSGNVGDQLVTGAVELVRAAIKPKV